MNNIAIDPTRLSVLLTELRLPAIKQLWPSFAERSDKEGWPAARLLMALADHEIAERDRRRLQRHLAEARLLPGKTLANFQFESVPMISRAQVAALCAGDAWLTTGANLLLIGPPGGGKSHLSSAIGLALLEQGYRVLFCRTSDLVQKLQVARRELALEAAIARLERFDLLILDLCAANRYVEFGDGTAGSAGSSSLRTPHNHGGLTIGAATRPRRCGRAPRGRLEVRRGRLGTPGRALGASERGRRGRSSSSC